jgi:hypothetical protein
VDGAPLSDETYRLFWLGNLVHKAVQDGLGDSKYLHEVPIKGTVTGLYRGQGTVPLVAPVSGRIDTLKLGPPFDSTDEEIIELKTVRSKAFDYPLPQPAHVLQVQCYLRWPVVCPLCAGSPWGMGGAKPCLTCLGRGFFEPQQARIVYIAKDGDKLGEYIVQRNQQLIDQIDDHLLRLEDAYQRYLQTGELPQALAKVPFKKKGVIVRYVKSGKWGKKGDPKLVDDHRTLYCDYRGTGVCCGD